MSCWVFFLLALKCFLQEPPESNTFKVQRFPSLFYSESCGHCQPLVGKLIFCRIFFMCIIVYIRRVLFVCCTRLCWGARALNWRRVRRAKHKRRISATLVKQLNLRLHQVGWDESRVFFFFFNPVWFSLPWLPALVSCPPVLFSHPTLSISLSPLLSPSQSICAVT